MTLYCNSVTEYNRIKTIEVHVGNKPLGGNNPIRLQSMTSVATNDIAAVVAQTISVIEAGGDYVRLTAQGVKEAQNLKIIKEQLLQKGYDNPIVADIHFNPKAAEIAARYVEKVRINPGNYVDKKASIEVNYTDDEYAAELHKIKQNLHSLLTICKEQQVAIRIGVNHGSLSQRVMSKYGDTPLGLVMSLLEFVQICIDEDFHNIVLSIKASNTRVMVQACRLLVMKMMEQGRCYPIHLGVTEAGEGEDARLKSAIGIGTLLIDGIGDTIRVSLTEDPEVEIPVAKLIVAYCTNTQNSLKPKPKPIADLPYNPFAYQRRKTNVVDAIGGNKLPVVLAMINADDKPNDFIQKPDYCLFQSYPGDAVFGEFSAVVPHIIVPIADYLKHQKGFPVFTLDEFATYQHHEQCNFVKITYNDIERLAHKVAPDSTVVFLLESKDAVPYREYRAAVIELQNKGITNPVVLCFQSNEPDKERYQIEAACAVGGMFIDGLADGICLENTAQTSSSVVCSTAFGILQASRVRFSKTEFISCPSCGRTLFDIQTAVKEIRERTGHLPNLKIGIMGCIVNGPGEMADADYGYVGAGYGCINLYKDKEVVKRNIPAEKAVDELIELIKANGDWMEK